MLMNDLKSEIMCNCNVEISSSEEEKLEDLMLSTYSEVSDEVIEESIISDDVNNFELTEEQANKIKLACYYEYDVELPLEDAISIVENNINELQNYFGLKELFSEEILKAENNEYGSLLIYYDFDEQDILCEAITQGTIIPNSMSITKLPLLNFEEMGEDEYDVFVDTLIEELSDMQKWVYYNNKGEKVIL